MIKIQAENITQLRHKESETLPTALMDYAKELDIITETIKRKGGCEESNR